uniref:Uncharacterized protein n=1 Tax=Vespula pensylvanica TaxID=30213 RepID=A0A834NQ83_VESPE|nr:hypothetical protein H0235_012124 [Vespula pensylvanica]
MQQEDPMCVGSVLRRQLPSPVARFVLHKPMYQKYGLAISKYDGGRRLDALLPVREERVTIEKFGYQPRTVVSSGAQADQRNASNSRKELP